MGCSEEQRETIGKLNEIASTEEVVDEGVAERFNERCQAPLAELAQEQSDLTEDVFFTPMLRDAYSTTFAICSDELARYLRELQTAFTDSNNVDACQDMTRDAEELIPKLKGYSIELANQPLVEVEDRMGTGMTAITTSSSISLVTGYLDLAALIKCRK